MLGKLRGLGHARIALGWSVATAAVRLGISPSHLRALEAGRRPLSRQLAVKMRDLYGVSIDVLCTPPH